MISYRLRRFKKKITEIVVVVFCFYFLISLIGCDAFVRKFTRKPKKDSVSKEEMVLVPEEYKGPQLTKEQLYRQDFMYWQVWHEELLTSLSRSVNHKKQFDCADRTVKSLMNLRVRLNEPKQKRLDVYLRQLIDLKDDIARDTYGSASEAYNRKAERIRRSIMREFSYSKVSKDLI